MTYNQDDATERWNRNAAKWHQFYGANDPYRRDMLDPVILGVLGDVSGKLVLDAGCGDGYLARKVARLGALVTGVDRSSRMLSLALEEQEKDTLAITYHNADIASLSFLPDRSFDVVITNNVIQDVEDYKGAFREFSRLLRSAGTYLQVINHPCFAMPVCGWVRDAGGKHLYRKVDRYFKRGPFPVAWRAETGMEPTVSWHRTLGDLVNALILCGFRIVKLIEPEPPDLRLTADPDRFYGDSRIPDFLVLACIRER
ncbi:MAG: methyltransferase domain-containing protein [Chloroflexi bacterium]|nr:methyltransferase domain-containing protein [Chloroflexota bacterium]